MGQVFLEYGTQLKAVSLFRYLGRTLSYTYNNFPAVEQNLWRARGKWGRLAKILERKGEDKRMTGRFYVAVVQVVLLFGFEVWVLTPRLEKSLKGFHQRAAWRMAGMGPKHQQDGTWLYPSIGAALVMMGLEEIGVYFACSQNMVAK